MSTDKKEKALNAEDVAQMLSAFDAILSESGNDDLSVEARQASLMARTKVDVPEPEPESEAPSQLPDWAQKVDNAAALFVPVKEESPQAWMPQIKKTGNKPEDKLEVFYQQGAERLTPGGTQDEQPVPLEPVNNYFTIDEWEQVAKPVLKRYLDLLELKNLNFVEESKRKNVAMRIKNLLPQVFPANKDLLNLSEVDLLSGKIKKEIMDKVNEVNTNPEVVKNWIMNALEEEEVKPVKGRPLPKGGRGLEEARGEFKDFWKGKRLNRLKSGFKQSKKAGEWEKYVEELADKVSKIGAQLLLLNTKYGKGIYRPVPVKEDFIETPYIKEKLEELADRAAKQLELKKGMVSMIGDMGTGKNYVVEHFASKTRRPFFYFPCSRGMDAADLGFHFEYRKNESIVVPSALARGLQTENAVILIDEPNALNPEVVAALHGLADHNRAFVYNGVKFKAAKGVIIVMTMNPATYAHVKALPEALSDRTLGQDMVMDYPPLTKLDRVCQSEGLSKEDREKKLQEDNSLDKTYLCDEALILKNAFPELKKYPDADFEKLWNVVLNGESSLAIGPLASGIEQAKPSLEMIIKILKVCDTWRKKYKAQDMIRTISLRGSIVVAERCAKTGDVRMAFLSLFKANSLKYDGGPDDYDSLQQIVNDTAELKMTLNEILAAT